MRWVRMPWTVIGAVVVCLFLAGLYGLRQYDMLGRPEYAVLAAGAGLTCLAIIGGLIYANYEPCRTSCCTGTEPTAHRRPGAM